MQYLLLLHNGVYTCTSRFVFWWWWWGGANVQWNKLYRNLGGTDHKTSSDLDDHQYMYGVDI